MLNLVLSLFHGFSVWRCSAELGNGGKFSLLNQATVYISFSPPPPREVPCITNIEESCVNCSTGTVFAPACAVRWIVGTA